MNMQSRRRQITVGLLSLVLCLSIMLPLMTASAASGPDLGRMCSLTVTTNDEYAEFRELTVPMRLYRVANVNANGTYTATEPFSGLDLSGLRVESTAQAISELTDRAEETAAAGDLTAEHQLQMINGTAALRDVPAGLYLLRSETVRTGHYEYTTMPILVQLPTPTTGVGGADWIYDAEIVVKQLQDQRLADLTITKTLEDYEPLLGPATFVFQVEAEVNGQCVYSNVETMFFDGVGTKTVTVEQLPAGAEVTVTEVYSGGAYRLTSSGSQTVTMAAEGAGVAFSNTYDGSIITSAGIQNHYGYDGKINGMDSWSEPQQITGGGENG